MSRDILKTLKTEHSLLRDMFRQMEETSDRSAKARSSLLAQIEANLLPHAKWEEIAFYPAFMQRANRDGLKTLAEAVLEHAAVQESVIPSVKAAEVTTPEFAGRMKVFAEMVEHHAKEEETTMFRMARAMFSADELSQFDEDYEAWKTSPEAADAVQASNLEPGVRKSPARPSDRAAL